MKSESQNKALAELDGWREAFPRHKDLGKEGGGILLPYRYEQINSKRRVYDLPDYLNFYDAIIPLIQKTIGDQPGLWTEFYKELANGEGSHIPCVNVRFALMRTPKKLAEALLRATGRWTP